MGGRSRRQQGRGRKRRSECFPVVQGRKSRTIRADPGRAVWLDQRQILAARGQREIRVQPLRVGRAVFAGGPYDQKPTRGQSDARWKGPFSRIRAVVRQVPAGKINRFRIRIVQFNPVRGLAVLV